MSATWGWDTQFTPPPSLPDFSSFHVWQAIVAHEFLHFEQFKDRMDRSWSDFESEIDTLSLPMNQYPTPDSAKAAIRATLEAAKGVLSEAEQGETPPGGVHYPYAPFFGPILVRR